MKKVYTQEQTMLISYLRNLVGIMDTIRLTAEQTKESVNSHMLTLAHIAVHTNNVCAANGIDPEDVHVR